MKLAIPTLLSVLAWTAAASHSSSKSSFAGAVAKRTNLPIDGINAEIQIPKISCPGGNSKQPFGGQILLGLDAVNCSSSTTVGIQFYSQNNRVRYRLFYQWLSQKPVFVKDVTIKAGDDLRFGIQGDEYLLNDTPYNGTIYFTNYSNGQNTTINTARKVPTCANNLENYRVAKFSPIQLSDVYYVGNYGTFVHGIPVSEGSKSYNLTDPKGRKLVTTSINGVSLNFTYAA